MATKDIRIQNLCDHRLLFEKSVLDTDLRTLVPTYPMGSVRGLEVLRFGLVFPKSKYSIKRVVNSIYGLGFITLQLNELDPYPEPLYELSYTAIKAYCPKCRGTGYVDDIALDSSNAVATVTGAFLLIQSVEKAIVTTKGSNPYYSWIGSGLLKLVGTKITDFAALSQEIESSVRSSLENLKNKQLKHQELNPLVSSDEVLGTIEKVTVYESDDDPTLIQIYVQYTSQSGNPYEYGQLLDLVTYRER